MKRYMIRLADAQRLGAIDRIEMCQPHGITREQLEPIAIAVFDTYEEQRAWLSQYVRDNGTDPPRAWVLEA